MLYIYIYHFHTYSVELSDKGSDESEDVMEGIQAALDQLNTFHRQILGKT